MGQKLKQTWLGKKALEKRCSASATKEVTVKFNCTFTETTKTLQLTQHVKQLERTHGWHKREVV